MEMKIIEQRVVFGKDFKIYGDFENPLFMAKDVAEWIDYSKTSEGYYNVGAMVAMVDESERLTINNSNSGGKSTFLTEDGLYEVLMQSRKPIAKQWKSKVKEILKDVRKFGLYAKPETLDDLLNNPDTMINILTRYKEEKQQRQQLQEQVEEQKPLVIFAESVQASKTSILISELAKLLKQNGVEMGQNRLFEWLRENGYLIKRKGNDYNMPTQYSMEQGLFEIKETTINHNDGHISVNKTPKVTGKGQIYFISKFCRMLSVLSGVVDTNPCPRNIGGR